MINKRLFFLPCLGICMLLLGSIAASQQYETYKTEEFSCSIGGSHTIGSNAIGIEITEVGDKVQNLFICELFGSGEWVKNRYVQESAPMNMPSATGGYKIARGFLSSYVFKHRHRGTGKFVGIKIIEVKPYASAIQIIEQFGRKAKLYSGYISPGQFIPLSTTKIIWTGYASPSFRGTDSSAIKIKQVFEVTARERKIIYDRMPKVGEFIPTQGIRRLYLQATIGRRGINRDVSYRVVVRRQKPGSGGPPSAGINFVRQGNFSNFGQQGGPWGTGQYSQRGIWWNSRGAKSRAGTITLDSNDTLYKKGFRTALCIINESPRSPHVYGTTSQRTKVRPNQTYKISVWVKAKNVHSDCAVAFTVDPQWAVRPICVGKGTYDWTQLTGTFKTGYLDYIDLHIISQDIGTVLLTGLTLTAQ